MFNRIAMLALAILIAATLAMPWPARAAETPVTLGEGIGRALIECHDARVELARRGDGTAIRVTTGTTQTWPGITLKAPAGRWDLARFDHLALELRNAGPTRVEVSCRIDSVEQDGKRISCTDSFAVEPGETRAVQARFRRRVPAELAGKLFGMRGYPFGFVEEGGIDPARVDQFLLFVTKPTEEHVFEVSRLRPASTSPEADAATLAARLFPMIDAFGQYVHKDWSGKTHSADELARHKADEAADLAARPGPEAWNRYGGWQAGPALQATGHFRTEKIQGKWWLVDPEGRLFWSHGIDCVRATTASTPITDREFYFQDLPPSDSQFGEFYGRSYSAAHGYYVNKSYQTFNFTGANLLRKYGPDWKATSSDLTHRRLRSWGLNTIANWSDTEIYLLRKTPYTATVSTSGTRRLEGSTGYWGKFADVFDPSFAAGLDRRMAEEKGKSAGDPWCLGYFVDNELGWGDELSLAVAALASPPDQPAKLAFLDDLKAKHGSIEKLNAAWGAAHESWDALLRSQAPPDQKKAKDDLAAFYTRSAEQYFRLCREAVQRVAPDQLYLGCRFAWVNDRAIHAAAKYCDVIGLNRYRDTVADFTLPDGLDKPCIIGEFHFGALDRGMFHTGLRARSNQKERAAAYESYVLGALSNPYLVGTHWFQFGDQATTGRSDGENYQIGFLDVCDTPYPEIVAASREVGAAMYRVRMGR